MNDVRRTLTSDVNTLVAYVPHLVGALIIAAVGWLLAWVVANIVALLLRRLQIDQVAERSGFRKDLASAGIRAAPSALLAGLAFWIVLLATLVQAVDALELAPLSDALRNLLYYTPHLVLAAGIVFIGVVVGDAIARGAQAALARAGVLFHVIIGTLLRAIVIILAILMALQQLTIDSSFLLAILVVVLGAVAAAVALACGWGARTLAENVIASRYIALSFHVGDVVELGGTAGSIEQLALTNVTITEPAGDRVVFPNRLFMDQAVRIARTRDRNSADM